MKKIICKTGLFLVCFFLLFRLATVIFLEKNSYAKYRSFKATENVDVLILGSSHSDNGLDAEQISDTIAEQTGADVTVFNYSIYGMRIEQLYFFAKELMKEKTPDLIILETFAFVPIADEHREILARRAFDPFPRSENILEGIRYCVKGDLWSYYIPFIKYHTRWKELSQTDLLQIFDSSYWKEAGISNKSSTEVMEEMDDYFKSDTTEINEIRALDESEKECLENLLKMLDEKGIELLFVGVPYKEQLGMTSIENVKINNGIRQDYVDDQAVKMLDMNRLWKELDFGYSDLYNEGHCNGAGKQKVTDYLTEFLLKNYQAEKWEGKR